MQNKPQLMRRPHPAWVRSACVQLCGLLPACQNRWGARGKPCPDPRSEPDDSWSVFSVCAPRMDRLCLHPQPLSVFLSTHPSLTSLPQPFLLLAPLRLPYAFLFSHSPSLYLPKAKLSDSFWCTPPALQRLPWR